MGLAQFSLPLSDRPPLGEWTITVSTDVSGLIILLQFYLSSVVVDALCIQGTRVLGVQ